MIHYENTIICFYGVFNFVKKQPKTEEVFQYKKEFAKEN